MKHLLYGGYVLLLICMLLYAGDPAHALQAGPTATPQPALTGGFPTPTPTLEPEMESPVGANAGLVCGAVSLVIIIIAGLVRSARWIQYRGRKEEDKGT